MKMYSHYLLYDSEEHCPIKKLWCYDEVHSRKICRANYKQYLETCPSNATYANYTSAESFVDAMDFYFQSKTLKDMYDAQFLTLYADVSENASHKETFSMFRTYRAENKNNIFRYYKMAAEVMDVVQKILQQNLSEFTQYYQVF